MPHIDATKCPWCRRWKRPDGTWGLDEDLDGEERRLEITVSHGLCPDCASRLRKQSGLKEERR